MGKTFLVTGATGLVGGALVRRLAQDGHRVLALARHPPVAPFPDGVRFVAADVRRLPEIPETVDGIIHAAAPTSGRFFTEHPDETYAILVEGTRALLDFACAHGTSAFVFLSSMEVYGAPATDAPLEESAGFVGDPAAPRSSYPRGKRDAEALCAQYAATRGLRAMSVRLAQTFGAGVPETENRVFAQFLRAACAGETIRLSTAGTSTRMYLETEDAVSAVLTVLEKGAAGEVYNAANPETYCSLAEMARRVDGWFGGGGVSVGRDDDPANACYPPPHHLRLDVAKLMRLGWRPQTGLEEMYRRLRAALKLPEGAPRIPKVVHYVWLGGGELPPREAAYVAGWRKLMGDWTFRCWGNEILQEIDCPYVREAVAARKWAFAADYVRLYVLAREGGFYLDTDVELSESLGRFRHDGLCLGLNRSSYPQTAFIGAEPGHPLVRELLDEYATRPFCRGPGVYDETPNNVRFRRLLERRGVRLGPSMQEGSVECLPGVRLYPAWLACTPQPGRPNLVWHHCSGTWKDPYRRKRAVNLPFGLRYVRLKCRRSVKPDDPFNLLPEERRVASIRLFRHVFVLLKLDGGVGKKDPPA